MVYDILVNFKKNAYEFYEWDKKDDIKNIKAIPVIKVDNKTLLDFTKYSLVVDNDFLKKIENKTEIYAGKITKSIKHACILYNEITSLALVFDDTGKVIGKSKLLFDEEIDLIESNQDKKIEKIEYKIIKKDFYNNMLTRKENYEVMLILKYLDNIFENKKEDEINYLFYECFNKKENDYMKSYLNLKNEVLNNSLDIIQKLKLVIKQVKK